MAVLYKNMHYSEACFNAVELYFFSLSGFLAVLWCMIF